VVDQKQQENAEYFNYLSSMITNDAIQDCHGTSTIQQDDSFHQQTGLKFKEETSKVLHLEHSFVWCWRRVEKISWTDHVRNEVLQRVKEERNILQTIKRKANWICHVLRRNCLLKHVTEGKIEVKGRRGSRRKQLLDDLTEKKGYCKLKEKALDHTMWQSRFGRDCGPVVRQTTERMNECMCVCVSRLALGPTQPPIK
jgi:replicative superfamily II helicase